LIDRWREERGIALEDLGRKVDQVMKRYMFARSHKEAVVGGNNELEELETPVPDAGEDSLNAALAAAAETDRLQEQADAEGESKLAARVAYLEGMVFEMAERIEKLTQLEALNTKNITRLDRNVRRVEMDPTVTLSVPNNGGTVLEPMQFASVVPGEPGLPHRTPQHTSQRPPNGRRPATEQVDQDAVASYQASRRRGPLAGEN
jgi:hypothetical protein